ncbi:hypothetical protein [Nostoc sp.]|uniref:hypothetical protein n=1 Tax=Nostoc sp. TaxID=1180 RepID=UPI002FFCAB3F
MTTTTQQMITMMNIIQHLMNLSIAQDVGNILFSGEVLMRFGTVKTVMNFD